MAHAHRHRLSHEYGRIRYGDVQRNWKKWETERHWDRRDEHEREGRGEHERK